MRIKQTILKGLQSVNKDVKRCEPVTWQLSGSSELHLRTPAF